MALRHFSAYCQWQVFDQGMTLKHHHSMNQWKFDCAERYTPGVRTDAISVQSPCWCVCAYLQSKLNFYRC